MRYELGSFNIGARVRKNYSPPWGPLTGTVVAILEESGGKYGAMRIMVRYDPDPTGFQAMWREFPEALTKIEAP